MDDDLKVMTKAAIYELADIFGVPSAAFEDGMPGVEFRPEAKTSRFDFAGNRIIYTNEDPTTVYEESGHFLEDVVNPFKERKNPDLTINFFKQALTEAFGYFCSRFSGFPRMDSYFKDWKTRIENAEVYLRRATGQSAHNSISKEVAARVEPQDGFILTHEKLIHKKKVVAAGEKLYAIMDGDDPSTITLSEAVSQAHHYGHKVVYDEEEPILNAYTYLYHVMGYDMGAGLYRMRNNPWKETDPEHALSMAHQIMQTRLEESPEIFIEIYKLLKKREIELNRRKTEVFPVVERE